MPSNESESEELHNSDDEKRDFRRASEIQRQKRATRRAERDANQMNLGDAAETKRLDDWSDDDAE